jgi:hypothetical protein
MFWRTRIAGLLGLRSGEATFIVISSADAHPHLVISAPVNVASVSASSGPLYYSTTGHPACGNITERTSSSGHYTDRLS